MSEHMMVMILGATQKEMYKNGLALRMIRRDLLELELCMGIFIAS